MLLFHALQAVPMDECFKYKIYLHRDSCNAYYSTHTKSILVLIRKFLLGHFYRYIIIVYL